MIAKTTNVDGETYISIHDLKTVIRERSDFVTGGQKGRQFDAYNLALASIVTTLEEYEAQQQKTGGPENASN